MINVYIRGYLTLACMLLFAFCLAGVSFAPTTSTQILCLLGALASLVAGFFASWSMDQHAAAYPDR